jgi:hypothetical protein
MFLEDLFTMSNPYYHSISSCKRFGGTPDDYLEVHEWFDRGKASQPDFKHRALSHHSQGIYDAAQLFGATILISTGARGPTRLIGEQHVMEDLGFVPSLQDWMDLLFVKRWMSPRSKLLFSQFTLSEQTNTISDQISPHEDEMHPSE